MKSCALKFRRSKYLLIWLCALAFFSCRNNVLPETMALLKSFSDSTVVIPAGLAAKTYNNGSADSSLLARPLKMIVYLNAKGCESCKLQSLLVFDPFIREHQNFNGFGVVIILHPSHVEAPDHFLKQIRFSHTVFYDLDGSFERLNPHLPQDERFHTFLLDKDNRVLLVGNPVHSAKLKKLYLAALEKQDGKGLNPPPVR